jgi:hypothetical protein
LKVLKCSHPFIHKKKEKLDCDNVHHLV